MQTILSGKCRISPLLLALLLSNPAHSFTPVEGRTIAKEANKYIGSPYVYGGESFKKGIDCSAFVKKIFKKYGYSLPRRATWQATNTKNCPTYYRLTDIKIGDTLYFKNDKGHIHHVAIVSGFQKGRPIITHARGKDYGVIREVINNDYLSELCAIKRFSECTSYLAGKFTEKELAAAILYVAEKFRTNPAKLYKEIEKRSGFNPLLITIKDSGKNTFLEELAQAGVKIRKQNGRLMIYPSSIDEAVFIAIALYKSNIRFRAGLAQIDPAHRDDGSVKDIFYPKTNLEMFLSGSGLW